jgi:type II restriction enzyme
MASAVAEQAILDALEHGWAILKFISANDVNFTGSHQWGFYLPKKAWRMYSPHPPEKGVNAETSPRIVWQDGRVTDSRVKRYGKGTRSEYRLTRFGRDFLWMATDNMGSLLVLVPVTHEDSMRSLPPGLAAS